MIYVPVNSYEHLRLIADLLKRITGDDAGVEISNRGGSPWAVYDLVRFDPAGKEVAT